MRLRCNLPGSREARVEGGVPARVAAAHRSAGGSAGGSARRPACRALPLALLAVFWLTPGCGLLTPLGVGTLVGPDYETPAAKTADHFEDFRDPRIHDDEARLDTWWTIFGDGVLDGLMAQMGAQNLTLQSAAERVSAARARANLVAGFLWPQSQGATGVAEAIHASDKDPNIVTPFDQTSTRWQVDVGASWEIDFWGRYRRAVEAADAELQASVFDYADVMVLLYAEVARHYIAYRTFQARLGYLRENVTIQQNSYDIVQARFDAGEVPERDLHEAAQVLEETKALIPATELGLRIENNALCVLVGEPPRDLSPRLGTAPIPTPPESVAVGIPADLLRRRPDVRRVERIAAASSARIGIAESDFYPRISVVGSLGVSAEHTSDFDKNGARTSYLASNFTWSILDYGRTASNVEAFEAEFRAAVLDYQDAVLFAGQEAENAIYALLKTQETVGPQTAAVNASVRSVQIVQDQYNEGEVDFSEVFLFASNLTQLQDRLATVQGDAAQAVVDLYRALGGGWQPVDAPPDGPQPDSTPQSVPQERGATR